MTTLTTKVDAVAIKISKLKLKGKGYGCGRDHAHGKAECPAKQSECHKCGTIDH